MAQPGDAASVDEDERHRNFMQKALDLVTMLIQSYYPTNLQSSGREGTRVR